MEMESFRNKRSEGDVLELTKVAILVMVGLPGSGKTTFCHTLPHILGDKHCIVHVCYDKIVPFLEEWNDEGSHGMWKKERAKVLLAAEGLINNILNGHGLKRQEKSTSRLKQSKLSTSLDQNYFTEQSKLEGERNILLTNEQSLQVKLQSEKTDVVAESATNSLNHLGQEAVEGIDLLEENEPVFDGVGHYFTLNSLSLDMHSDYPLIEGFNFSQGSQLKNRLILLCVDDNFYYRSMRKEWWNLAAKYELPFCTLVLNCDVDTCIKRARERVHLCPESHNVNVPIEVIKRMSERLELPDEKLCLWEKYCIILDSDSLKITTSVSFSSRRRYIVDEASLVAFNHVKQILFSSMLDPAKPLNREVNSDCTVATPSLVHRVDLILRQIVGKSDRSLKAEINKRRKAILEDLRNGKLSIPTDLAGEESEGSKERLEEYVATLIDTCN